MVTAIVGTVLNPINQGDRLFATPRFSLAKLAMTCLVPYLVGT